MIGRPCLLLILLLAAPAAARAQQGDDPAAARTIPAAPAGPAAAAAPAGTASPHGELADACSLCHTASGWTPVRIGAGFDHARSGFALDGAHGRTECRSCHAALDFSDTPAECATCHQDVHRGELGADCAQCHTPRSFVDHAGMVRLHQVGRFPLTGSHAMTDCEACHTPAPQGGLTFVGRPTECQSCHLESFQATTDPDHEASGFPRDCAQCHATTLWDRTRFNHDGTAFPLTGAHRATPCAECHVDNQFGGTPTACVSCHQTDYDATRDPAHGPAGFATTCESCHTTASWEGDFDHAATEFPLTGAHLTTTCQECHGDGVYGGKSTLCISCHQTDWDGTTDPGHAAAQFPTTCESCHTTARWDGATFDHDGPYFPIYSGDHRGKWESCSTCHQNPASYAEFTCLTCHEHDQSKMDDTHQGESGYSYTSQACYGCHPRGEAE